MSDEIGPAPVADNPTEAAPTPAEPAPAESNWVTNIQDADLRGWAEGKHFHEASPEQALKSHMHLEKLFTADKAGHTVRVLTDSSTPEEVNEFYTKLGRPEEASGYDLAVPEGADGAFAEAAAAKFHELGLTSKQASELGDWWNGQASGAVEQTTADYEAGVANDTAELRKEWGAAYDKNISAAKAAASEFGLDATQVDGMEKALGFGGLMRFMQNIGSKLGEDIVEGTDANTGSEVLTPAAAKQKMNELQADPQWTEAFFGGREHPGHADAVFRKEQLAKLISGVAA